ncbi:MAG TPA: hypothetical protein VGM41_14540 [Chitinophagaceae bacterium]|jgi:hypothetical protein
MKNILRIAFVAVVALSVNSCKKNNVSVDKDPPLSAPTNAEFSPATKSFAALYYVQSGSVYAIPVGLTNVSNTDRTVSFTYSSATAVAGQQYNAPASLTIKAGTALDTLRLAGIAAGEPLGRSDVLKIKISGDIPGVYQRDSIVITLKHYCDVVLSSFTGAYNNSYDDDGFGPYGPYTPTITGVTSTGPTSGTITVANFAYGELGDPTLPIKINLDWSNPANFTATIPTQTISNSYGPYGAVTITGILGTNTFSSCDNTFNLSYTMYVAAGSFGDITTVMAR